MGGHSLEKGRDGTSTQRGWPEKNHEQKQIFYLRSTNERVVFYSFYSANIVPMLLPLIIGLGLFILKTFLRRRRGQFDKLYKGCFPGKLQVN